MGRKNKQKRVAQRAMIAYNYWLERALRVACSSVEWIGLPDTIDTIWMENILNTSGSAIVFRDDITGELFVGANGSSGNIDWYAYPEQRMAIMRNGDSVRVSREESVIIYNNNFRTSDISYYSYIADEMSNVVNAIRVNCNTQKTMPMIPANQAQALAIENVYSDLENNIPYVILDEKSISITSLKDALVFDNRKSFTSDLMIQVKRETWNDFLTFCGIDNSNVEKKAQVNSFETRSNLEEVLAMKRSRLNSREEGCKLLNNKFGLNAEVRYYGQGRGDMLGGIYGQGGDDMQAGILEQESGPESGNTVGNPG